MRKAACGRRRRTRKAFRKTENGASQAIVLDLSSPEREYQQHMIPTERLLNWKWMMGYVKFWQNHAEHPGGIHDRFSVRLGSDLSEASNWNSRSGLLLPMKAFRSFPSAREFERVNTGFVIGRWRTDHCDFCCQQFRRRLRIGTSGTQHQGWEASEGEHSSSGNPCWSKNVSWIGEQMRYGGEPLGEARISISFLSTYRNGEQVEEGLSERVRAYSSIQYGIHRERGSGHPVELLPRSLKRGDDP